MDVDERFQTILQECRWVKDAGTAARLLPALGQEAPSFVPLPWREGDVRPSIPIVCASLIAAPVASTIVAAASGAAPDISELPARDVAGDPLVAAMADIFAQCARPGLRTQLTPALAVAWVVGEVLNGRAASLPGMEDSLAQKSRTVGAQVAAASGPAKVELLQSLGWALTCRIAGGLSLAAMAGAPVQTGGLYRQLLANPLVLAFPRGTLERNPGAAAPLLGLSLEPDLVNAAQKAGAALLTASRARLEAGKAEPLDVALQALIPSSVEPEQAALHPTAGPALIGALPTLSSAKDLQAAGVDRRFAKGLASARGARAMASAWTILCDALGTWDILSSLVSRVVSLQESEGRMIGPLGPLPADARWPLLLPRPNSSGTMQAVVAVRFTEVRESLLSGLHNRSWSLQNIARTFDEVARANGASVRQIVGDHGVCTFPFPELALQFARILRTTFGPEAGLELGDDETTIPIPPTSAVGVGLALGVVEGGTDGENSSLGGRGVAEAVSLAGNGRATRLFDDGVGVREAGWGGSGLLNESIVASNAFVRTVIERTKRRNRPVHVRGEGGTCAGVSDDFALAPLAGWWEVGEDLVAAALLIDSDSMEGASEIKVMSTSDFKEWHASDRSAAALRSPPRSARSERMESHSRSVVSSGPRDLATTEFDGAEDYGSDFDAPSLSFMDGGGSSLRARPQTAPPEEPSNEVTADPDTADGFLMPSDDLSDETGYGFSMANQPEDSDVGAFVMNNGTRDTERRGPAPPMVMLDEEPGAGGGGPVASAPMMLDPEPSDAFGARHSNVPSAPMMVDEPATPAAAPPMMLDDASVASNPAPPMMLDDPSESTGPAPPMMLDDDAGPVGGLLGEVQGEDPFGQQEDSSTAGLEPADSAFGPAVGREELGGASMLHATYQGEMELAGLAGFSLAGGESVAGDDPFRDPQEDTGFFDERLSSTPRRIADSGTQPKAAGRAVDGAMVRELVRLLRGYVVVKDGSTMTFGLPDNGLLRDAWTHEGTAHQCYVSFLRSKVADGFIPRADRVIALVPGVSPEPIDTSAIEAAAAESGL